MDHTWEPLYVSRADKATQGYFLNSWGLVRPSPWEPTLPGRQDFCSETAQGWEIPLAQLSWQQITGVLLALPFSLPTNTTPSVCWHHIHLQNLICGAEGPGAFLKLPHFPSWEWLEKKVPIFMLYFSSYNRFGNNWGTQQQSLENLQFLSWSSGTALAMHQATSERNQSQWADKVRGRHLRSFKSCILLYSSLLNTN